MSLALAGNLASAAAQWLGLLLLARWTTPHAVGEYALALAICGPVILFANLQLSGLQSTDARSAFSFDQYFALRLVTTAGAFTVIAAAAAIFRLGSHASEVIVLLAFGRCCEAVSDAVYGALMRRSMFGRVSRALVTNAVLSAIGFGLCAFFTRDARWAAAGWSAGSCVTLGFVTLPAAVDVHHGGASRTMTAALTLLRGFARPGELARLAAFALPMGVISMLLSLQANVPQYVINHFLGSSAVGVFALLSYPFLAGNIAVTAMGQAAAPQFANALEHDDAHGFRRVLALTMGGGAALGVVAVTGAWLFGAQLLRLVYSAEYARHAALLTTIAAATAVRYACLPVGVAVTAQRRLAVQVWLRSGTLVLAAAAVWAGVSWAGLQGGAVALLCTSVIEGFLWVRIAADGLTSVGSGPAPVPLPLT